MLKLCIAGAAGKMGKMIHRLAAADDKIEVTGLLENKGHPEAGGEITDDIGRAFSGADCVIDFTSPEAVVEHAGACRELKLPMVIGVTGLDASRENAVKEAAKDIPVVFSPNMAPGVNLLFAIAAKAAAVLSDDFDIRVDETHHVHKKDAPSGTAKMILSVIRDSSGTEAPCEAKREGEVVGNHGITFDNAFETLEIRHNAKTREVFASGAIRAAKYIVSKPAGLYSMSDVLGIK